MVRHIVLFWLKDKSDENIRKTAELLLSMNHRIEGLSSLEVGCDAVHDERSCDICLNCLFADMEALERYRTHPVHLPVQAYMHQARERSFSCDYIL
jgi:hypothetical protein